MGWASEKPALQPHPLPAFPDQGEELKKKTDAGALIGNLAV